MVTSPTWEVRINFHCHLALSHCFKPSSASTAAPIRAINTLQPVIYSPFSNLSCIWSHWDSNLFAASLRLSGIWDFWSPPATESYSDYLKSIEYVPFITASTPDLVLINHSSVTKRWQILKHRSHPSRQVFTSGIWDFWSPPATESYSDYLKSII
jgi:hypothetical protein